jgi:hypothetical protein
VASLESLTAMCFPVIGDLNITVADTVTHFCLNLLTRGRYIDDAEVLIVTVKLLSAMLLQPSNVARVVQHSGIEAFIAVIGRHAEDSVLIQECVGAIEIISRTSPGRGRCEAMSGAVRSKRVVVHRRIRADYWRERRKRAVVHDPVCVQQQPVSYNQRQSCPGHR